ncbi:zinc-binding dehydrogenase [Sediminibacillus dalangtanensis]|uniref:Zinc-binding dehydrogenase n=1 Tax=Sediminibacillus dalangtanensis TaxID=2729421 RepID=A0ABX7VX52_9BACI|nr:NADP-dependent oxidoreductase [Sediminibacillus dalangtanensis]QTN01542.1 zinc-binding dehydrogenase [Sediminibacillus dalangtanensis]
MKAVIIDQYGSAEQLHEAEVEKPEIESGQVLVEMHATSVNPIDWKLREGYLKEMLPFEFPIILGWDAAGIVKEIGSDVSGFQPGDRVFARPATTRNGTYAEYAAIDEKLLAKIPENISFEEAAAVPLAGLTAWQCLVDFAEIKEGDKVLIHAGSGGVGSFGIQIAKSFGAYVASTASGKNEDFLKVLGVDRFINYQEEDFADALEDYDIVVDTLGGDIQKKSFDILKEGGKLVSVVGEPDKELASKKQIKSGSLWLNPDGNQLAELGKLMKDGKLDATIGRTFPLTTEGVREAHKLSETNHARGKIVIKIR